MKIHKILIIKSILDPKTDSAKFFLGNLASGGAAGASTSLFFYPFDYARIRLASQMINANKKEYKSLFDVLTKITKSNGISGLYQGFGITAAGTFIYRAIYFGTYDSAKPLLKDKNIFFKFLIAHAVTFFAAFISHPIDVLRLRLNMKSR